MVYFIGTNDLLKIGYTENLQSRIRALEEHIPFRLEVYAVVEGDMLKERYYHSLFAKYHYKREWFHFTEEVKMLIDSIPDKINVEINRRVERRKYLGGIRMLRYKAGLTQAEMAKMIGVHHTNIDYFEARFEEGSADIKSLNKYLDALGYVIRVMKKGTKTKGCLDGGWPSVSSLSEEPIKRRRRKKKSV